MKHVFLRAGALLASASIVGLSSPAWARGSRQRRNHSEEINAAPADTTNGGSAQAESTPVKGKQATSPGGLSPIDAVVGHIGFGYFTGMAPVGLRYWFNRTTALDAGIDVAISSGGSTAQRYGAELGGLLALAHYHYSVVFARLGMRFSYTIPGGKNPPPAQYALVGSAFLGAELFLGAFGFPNISLQGGYGVEASYTARAGGSGGSFLIGTAPGGLSVVGVGTLGFHIYL